MVDNLSIKYGVDKKTIKKCIMSSTKKYKLDFDAVLDIIENFDQTAENIANLPPETAQQILLNLPIKDIMSFCSVNERINNICEDEYFWKTLLRRDYGPLGIGKYKKHQEISAKENYKKIYNRVKNTKNIFLVSNDLNAMINFIYDEKEKTDQEIAFYAKVTDKIKKRIEKYGRKKNVVVYKKVFGNLLYKYAKYTSVEDAIHLINKIKSIHNRKTLLFNFIEKTLLSGSYDNLTDIRRHFYEKSRIEKYNAVSFIEDIITQQTFLEAVDIKKFGVILDWLFSGKDDPKYGKGMGGQEFITTAGYESLFMGRVGKNRQYALENITRYKFKF